MPLSTAILRLGSVLLAFSLTGCASSGKLRSDYDQDADFGAYRTYNFMEHDGDDQYQSLFHQKCRWKPMRTDGSSWLRGI